MLKAINLKFAKIKYSGDSIGRDIRIEIETLGKPIGKQDQYIAAYGGLQFIQFNPDGSVYVDPVICEQETKLRLQEGLLMLYTGMTRSADDILREQSHNTENDGDKRASLQRIACLAHQLREALVLNDLEGFGEVLHAGWLEKKKLASGISNPAIDSYSDSGNRARNKARSK